MRMEKGWTMQVPLLVLGLLSLLTPLASAQELSYQNVVTRFIKDYNRRSGSPNLFRLSVLNLQPGENNDPAIPHPLSFTITETVCSNTEDRDPDECDFKENGRVKECFGVIGLDSTNPLVDISCDGPSKTKRNFILDRLRDLWNRIRRLGK
ncbi:antibacterial peptide PMAP-37-like [Gracilinanus agilis]|uniref:antibacterial peptide PMAP-37-like n=1 Tax=Gracilinanus agilis TaxID=191870 RepID=UPI001CFD9508|nr:antibacterial peptide PMAP-37-like [Gracilinanus agilis]